MTKRKVRLGRGAPRLRPIELACGAVLHLRPHDAEYELGAAIDANRVAQALGDARATATWEVEYAVALARRLIEAWDNVLGDDEVTPAEVTPDNVERLLREIPGAILDFRGQYARLMAEWHAEGEAYGGSPAGAADSAPDGATTAGTSAPPAPPPNPGSASSPPALAA